MQISTTLKRIVIGKLKVQALVLGSVYATAGFISLSEKMKEKDGTYRKQVKESYDFHMPRTEPTATIVPLPGEHPGDYYYDFVLCDYYEEFVSKYGVPYGFLEVSKGVVDTVNAMKQMMESYKASGGEDYDVLTDVYNGFVDFVNDEVLSKELRYGDLVDVLDILLHRKDRFETFLYMAQNSII